MTLWVGAICGIAVGVTTLVDWFSASDPADVVWESTMDGDRATMSVVPPLRKQSDPFTEPFPLAFRLRNRGEQTAEDVAIRIEHPENIAFKAPKGIKSFRQRVPTEKGKLLTTFEVGDLKPGEDKLTETIEAAVENTLYFTTRARTKDGTAVIVKGSVPLAYRLRASVMARELQPTEATFFINVARATEFEKNRVPYLRRMRSGEWQVIEPRG
ncbi:MAG TPA: hypothetical protein VF587_14060 [Solirubrobacteraceae bacterium]